MYVFITDNWPKSLGRAQTQAQESNLTFIRIRTSDLARRWHRKKSKVPCRPCGFDFNSRQHLGSGVNHTLLHDVDPRQSRHIRYFGLDINMKHNQPVLHRSGGATEMELGQGRAWHANWAVIRLYWRICTWAGPVCSVTRLLLTSF